MSQSPDDGRQVDVEAAWAQIVLHWDDDHAAGERADDLRVHSGDDAAGDAGPDGAVPAAPAVPEVGDAPADDAATVVPGTPGRRSRRIVRPAEDSDLEDWPEEPGGARPSGPAAAQGTWDASTSRVGGDRAADAARWDDDLHRALDDEGYVPDDPPPLPRGDLVSWLAWTGVLGAPLFLLLAALFWRSAPSLLIATAVVAFVAGFGTLVLRLPATRDDDPDDGAVV